MFRHNSAFIWDYKPSLKHVALETITMKETVLMKFLQVVNSIAFISF